MKSMNLWLACCFATCIACQSGNNTGGNGTPTADTTNLNRPAPMPGATCYQGIIKQDTFRLQVLLTDTKAVGTLAYRFKEKDSSYGNIEGTMRGDTLFAIYTYMAEARRSMREVAFLLTPTEAVEGYGMLEQHGNLMRFTPDADIQFGNFMRMQKIACDNQPFDGLKKGQE